MPLNNQSNQKYHLRLVVPFFQAQLIPWLGAKVWGGISVNIIFAAGGINLVGYIVETKFPLTGLVTFSKFPVYVK